MKTLKLISIIGISLLFFFVGCDKDDDLINEQLTNNLETVAIKVVLPDESDLDLTTTKLISMSEEFNVSASGDTKAVLDNGSRSLILLENVDGDPMLMSIISDSNREISIKTTMEAAVYYGLGTAYLPEEVKEKYFNQSNELIEKQEILSKANTIFTSNINALTTDTFISFLYEELDEIRNNEIEIDINKRTVEVFQNEVRSGLQIEEVDFETIKITNIYRRRTHAFLYKTSYKDENDNEQILIEDIVGEDQNPNQDSYVPATKSIRSFTGTIQNWAAGKGTKMAINKSDPIKLDLDENHKECTYKVRVIGPTVSGSLPNKLTSIEQNKLEQLKEETLGFDFVLPLFLDVIGQAKLLKGLDETKYKNFVKSLILFAKSVPSINQPLNEGDYPKALNELVFSLINKRSSSEVVNMLKSLIDDVLEDAESRGKTISIPQGDRIQELVKNFAKILKATDLILKLVDYGRIFDALVESNSPEQWTVKAKRTPVTLAPKEAVAFPFILKSLQATIKDTQLNAGQIFEYRWSTTGNYGVLRRDDGQEGTSFSTSSTLNSGSINYLGNTNDADLPVDAKDKVMVEVIIKGPGEDIVLGKDTATVKIRPYKYDIIPKGVEISGGINLGLNITRVDGSEDITNNEFYDYRIVWSTQGLYGLFYGSQSDVTIYNSNKIKYISLDKDVKNAVEKVTAKIYSKRKEQRDEDYTLLDRVETSIKIDNEENTISFPVSASNWESFRAPEAGGERVVLHAGFQVPVYDEAISYKLQIVDYNIDGNSVNSVIGKVFTWTNQNTSAPTRFHELTGKFGVTLNSGSVNTISGFYDVVFESVNSAKGQAVVTITIED